MAIKRRCEIRRMRTAVHVDRAIRVWTADVEDEDALQLGELRHLDAVGRQELTDTARRLASRVRLELIRQAIFVHAFGPRLEGNLCCFHCLAATAAREPHAILAWRGEDCATLSVARCGSGSRSCCATASTAARSRRRATAAIRNANLNTRTL